MSGSSLYEIYRSIKDLFMGPVSRACKISKRDRCSRFLYTVGFLTCAICLNPVLRNLSDSDVEMAFFCPSSAEVHNGLRSSMYRESLLISLAVISPMLVDLIFDTVGHRTGNHCCDKGISTRWILILTSLTGDFLLLYQVIPYQNPQLMWTIFNLRGTLRTIAIYDFLHCHGAPVWTCDEVMVKVTLFSFGQVAQLMSFSMYDYHSYWGIFSIIVYTVFFMLVGNHYIQFSALLLNQRQVITSDEYCCFKYISSVLFYSAMSLSTFIAFGPRHVCDLDESYLTVQNYHSAGVIFLLAVFHSRRTKFELENTNHSLETKRMFVRYVSHEIRTPLNTVATGLTLILSLRNLLDTCSDSNILAALSNIFTMTYELKESCDVAVNILNELLLYEKLEGGILELEKTVEPAKALVHEAVRTFFIQARSAGLELQVTYDNLEGVMLEVDKAKISQILRNLISNAIKFSRKGGLITVHTSLHKRYPQSNRTARNASNYFLRVAVKDSGAGITMANQAKLFKSIIQFHPGMLQGGKGSGLGLYISKGLADLHGAHISVNSEGEGLGSAFNLELECTRSKDREDHPQDNILSKKGKPLRNGRVTFSEPQSDISSPSDDREYETIPLTDSRKELKKLEVLIVDDSTMNRKMMVRFLSMTRICDFPSEADDGYKAVQMVKEALEYSRLHPIDSSSKSSRGSPSSVTRIDLSNRVNSPAENMVRSSRYRPGNESPSLDSDAREGAPPALVVPDAVLLDFVMPFMNGPDASKLMRDAGYNGMIIGTHSSGRKSNKHIVCVTGNALPEDVEHFLNSGANSVLTKPVNTEKLKLLLIA